MREIRFCGVADLHCNAVREKGETMPISLNALKKLSFVGAASTLLLVSLPAAATVAAPLPEPDTLGLLAAGAIGGFVIWVRNRRK